MSIANSLGQWILKDGAYQLHVTDGTSVRLQIIDDAEIDIVKVW